jgi:membrane protease YdiL (CAAX protease family)
MPTVQIGAAVIVALCVTGLVVKGEHRKLVGNGLLIAMSLFVVVFLFNAFGASGRLMKSNTAVGADMAEMGLRITSCLEMVEKFTASSVPKAIIEQRVKAGTVEKEKARRQAFDNAEKALQNAVQQNPKNAGYKVKLAIALLVDNKTANKARIAELIDQLRDSTQIATDPADYMVIAEALQRINADEKIPASSVPSIRAALTKTLPQGWYQTNALLKVYESAGDKTSMGTLEESVRKQYLAIFFKLIMVASVALVSTLVGIVTILVQLGTMASKPAPVRDPVGLDLPWKTIYAVFISWFTSYILISLAFHQVLLAYPDLSKSAVLVALSTAATYLLSNLPAPFLIYHLALKPRNLPFWASLRMTAARPPADQTEETQPKKPSVFGLIVRGYLTWCSAFPIVFVAAIAASKLIGSQGSDNPVIGQIVQAANASNPVATLVFYLTLGVMAPFFEEMLFRGFLYSSLKTKIGTPMAMVASSAMFACMHFDKGGMLMLFAIGFVLVFALERTRNLVPSMVAHGLWNSGSFTMALVLFSGS